MSCDVCPSNKLMVEHGDWFIWYLFPFPFSQISHGHKACYTLICIDCNISKAYKIQDECATRPMYECMVILVETNDLILFFRCFLFNQKFEKCLDFYLIF